MTQYIVYDNTLGTATTRPIVGVFDCDPSELTNQQALLPGNETAVAAPVGFQFEENDQVELASTATGGSSNTIADTGENWETNCFAGFDVAIQSGTGSGQTKTIVSNTATTLTISGTWSPLPDATSFYRVLQSVVKFKYTYNTSTFAVTRVMALRDTLAQRQEQMRIRIADQKAKYLPNLTTYRKFTDGRFDAWQTYFTDLDAITAQGIWATAPERITWPTVPTDTEDDTESVTKKLYRRGNVLGLVALGGGGNPLLALADMGVNSNGRYWKFTDGQLLMSHRLAINYSSASQLSATWTFPVAMGGTHLAYRAVTSNFSNKNNSNATASGQLPASALANCAIVYNTNVDTGVQIIVRDSTAGFVSGDLTWMEVFAMGRWN